MHMRAGALTDLKPGEFGIVLGGELARALGVRTGDPVVVITPQGTMTPAGTLPRLKTFRVVGVFEVGMYEFDSGLALIDLDDARKLYRHGRRVGRAPEARRPVRRAGGGARARRDASTSNAEIRDWTRSHANFFRAVQIEKRVMFIILTLIIAVAAFNIVSAQVMTVTDKQADIAILRTLGASPCVDHGDLHDPGRADRHDRHADRRGRRRAARAQRRHGRCRRSSALFNVQFLDKTVYYISELPSDLQRGDVVDDRRHRARAGARWRRSIRRGARRR